MVETVSDLHQIVVIGSCSLDFTTYAVRLPYPGETLQGKKFITGFGGKGANQCLTAAKLGEKPFMICRLGDDQWGVNYKEHLKTNGVDVSCVRITPNTTTGIAQITVAENGQNQIIIVPGANSCLSTTDVQEYETFLQNAKVVVGQLETPFETTLKAFQMSHTAMTILNAAPMTSYENMQKIIAHCYILCVNETEASMLINCPVDVSNVSTALKKLSEIKNNDNKGCKLVLITLGENGAAYLDTQDMQAVHVKCEAVKPVDTTGAGDAFVGALAVFLVRELNRRPIHQIVGAACRVATHSVTLEGAQTAVPSNVFDRTYEHNVLTTTS